MEGENITLFCHVFEGLYKMVNQFYLDVKVFCFVRRESLGQMVSYVKVRRKIKR